MSYLRLLVTTTANSEGLYYLFVKLHVASTIVMNFSNSLRTKWSYMSSYHHCIIQTLQNTYEHDISQFTSCIELVIPTLKNIFLVILHIIIIRSKQFQLKNEIVTTTDR